MVSNVQIRKLILPSFTTQYTLLLCMTVGVQLGFLDARKVKQLNEIPALRPTQEAGLTH